jgi:hypothetical protein
MPECRLNKSTAPVINVISLCSLSLKTQSFSHRLSSLSGTRKRSQILLDPGEAKEPNTNKRGRNWGRDRKEYGGSI